MFSHVRLFVTPWSAALQAPVEGLLQARILDRVAIPFSRGSFRLRDQTYVSCISGITSGFFTI